MEERKAVYSKLVNIQEKLKAPKNQYNSYGKYSYRNCEDILEALKPLLKANKCTLVLEDNVVLIGERYYIKSTAFFTDLETGHFITCSAYAREEENKKGMDGSQVTGASSSYARKYCLNGLLLIDDTKDSDFTNTSDKPSKVQQINEKRPPAPPAPEAPAQKCMKCGKTIEAGGGMTSAEVAQARIKKYGLALCGTCAEAMRREQTGGQINE